MRFAHSAVPRFLTVASSADSALSLQRLPLTDFERPGFAFSLGVWKIRMTVAVVGQHVDAQVAAAGLRVTLNDRGAWPAQPGPEMRRNSAGGASVGAGGLAVGVAFFGGRRLGVVLAEEGQRHDRSDQ